MTTKIVKSELEHRVVFLPTRADDPYPGPAVVVRSRSVADLVVIPDCTNYLHFYDIVLVTIETDGDESVVETMSFNATEPFMVVRDESAISGLLDQGWESLPVHPSLSNILWILGKGSSLLEQGEARSQLALDLSVSL